MPDHCHIEPADAFLTLVDGITTPLDAEVVAGLIKLTVRQELTAEEAVAELEKVVPAKSKE
jgi:hypothetical protein